MADESGRLALGKVRALWCNVLVPRPYRENGVAKAGTETFDATIELTKEEVTPVLEVIKKVAAQKWPGKSLKELKLPLKKAEVAIAEAIAKGKDASIYTEGTYLLEARSKYQPPLSWAEAGKLVELDGTNLNVAKQKFYNGAIVVPRLNFVIKTKNGDGVKAYLDMVFATVGKDGKPGKKIGGISAAEAFKGYVGAVSGEDPTGGQATELDDEF
jgi:Protein of unknown function (DUF2815)